MVERRAGADQPKVEGLSPAQRILDATALLAGNAALGSYRLIGGTRAWTTLHDRGDLSVVKTIGALMC